MAAPIGTIPQGLLGLLQLKQTGQNPVTLLETVAPQIDLTNLYLLRNLSNEFGLFGSQPAIANATTKGQLPFLVAGVQCAVPQNEMWYLQSISGFVANIAAADTLNAGIYGGFLGGGGSLLTDVRVDVINARIRTWVTPPLVTPLLLPPGFQFFLMVQDILNAGGINVLLSMRATRMPI